MTNAATLAMVRSGLRNRTGCAREIDWAARLADRSRPQFHSGDDLTRLQLGVRVKGLMVENQVDSGEGQSPWEYLWHFTGPDAGDGRPGGLDDHFEVAFSEGVGPEFTIAIS